MSSTLKSIPLNIIMASLFVALSTSMVSTTLSAAPLNKDVRAAQASKITLQQAIVIASKNASGELISAEFDEDDDNAKGAVYEIVFKTIDRCYEFKIDANTSKIISTKIERIEEDGVSDYNTQRRAKVNVASAINIAEKRTGGTTLEIELKEDRDYADHPLYYKADLLKGNDIIFININAVTGATFANKYKR